MESMTADYMLAALALLDGVGLEDIERRTTQAFDKFARAVDRREEQWSRHPGQGKSGSRSTPRLPAGTIEGVGDWRTKAACRLEDGDWIEIPKGGVKLQRSEKQRELAFCEVCPVKVKCLEHAQPLGIWGGTLPAERREPRRRK